MGISIFFDARTQPLPLVEHRRENEDPESRIVGFTDGGDGLQPLASQ